MVGVLALLPGLLAAGGPLVGGKVPKVRIWHPGGIQATASVPGSTALAPKLTSSQMAAAAKAAKPYRIPKVVWPEGTVSVRLSPPARTADVGASTRAGTLPVTVASADPAATAARSVSVTIGSRDAAAKAAISGVVLTVARADGHPSPSKVAVSLDYSGLAGAYGGAWSDRLRLVALPSCALTTPQVPACRAQTPVRFRKDASTQVITAQLSASNTARVLGLTATASGSVGTYTATSLSPSGQWSAGGNSGSFTYSYPIELPSAPGGSAPDVSLDYDSGSVDGQTSATNAQASWIGDGWKYSPGFIERSYQSCAQDGITNSADLCWAGNQVQLSLGAHSSTLVRDDASGSQNVWKLQSDDGTKVIQLSGVNNGAWHGEAWEIITPDGTQYYFGQNYLPTTNASGVSTNSAWTEPIYCPKSTEPCYSAGQGANSFATNMAWRWNLAYVVDPHGNLQTYDWDPETNYYVRGYVQGNGSGTNTLYTRGGTLHSISYGYRLTDAIAGVQPVDTVTFGVEERCLANCDTLNASTAPNWPDVPFDEICASQTSTGCTDYAPTFFSTKRLKTISTSVSIGGTPHPVDTYTLDQMFPAPEAGVVSSSSGVSATHQGDGTVAVMWLNSIQRQGSDTLGGGSAVSLPKLTFVAMETANRVDGAISGAAALFRPRMDSITTESGSQIVVSYADPQCSRVNHIMPSSPDSDTLNCFAQYWTPTDGTDPVLDWFNKLPVSEVTVNDLVAPTAWSQAQVTTYQYDKIAWHRDDSPLTLSAQRTYNDFRGYRTVTATVGTSTAESVPTQTVTTYLQGMDGDVLADGTKRAVSVSDSVGDTVTDSDWLRGDALETQSLLGVKGTPEKKSVSGPWTYRTTATEAVPNSMPALVARMPKTTESRTYELWHDGTWKHTENDTTYDGSGRVITADAKGDGTAAVPEVCTTTSYAQDTGRNVLMYPDEVKAAQGTCGATATATNTVSDTRTYYDTSTTLGAVPGAGDPTSNTAVDSYDGSGNPVYVAEKQASYDVYGRVKSSTDADGHTTSTSYSAVGTSPDTVTLTNPMGWTTSSTLDPARALPVSATDVNGELTTETYDGLGRITAAWGPLHSQSAHAPADTTFDYRINGASAPTTVSTATLRDDGSYGTEVKIYDGELRPIQDQTPTVDASAGRLISDTHYNSLGQTVKTTAAYYDKTAAPSTTTFIAANDSVIPSEGETFYDGLGRTVQELSVAKGVNQWSTFTAYHGVDETDTTPPAGGTATSEFTDAIGRKSASWKYNTATPTRAAADAVATSYTYTGAGTPATTSDAAGNLWKYAYDLHGRQIQLTDPETGTTKTTYSPGGEVLSTTDGRGTQLSFSYDALGRKAAEYDTTSNAEKSAPNQLAAWTYDTLPNGKGQLSSSTRYTQGSAEGSPAYTEAITGYTALYQPTGTQVTIPSAEGSLAGSYSVASYYTATTSLLHTTAYTAEAGLPREGVNYAYDVSGALYSFGGTYTYLNQVAYNPQGQVLQTNFGPSGKQLARTETYDQPTGRMLTMSDATQTSVTGPVDSTAYTYSQAGSITSEATGYNGDPANDTQCFGYDHQNRLTSAWTDTDGVSSPADGQILGIGGCVDTAPVAGKVTGGPAPYWQSYSYDALGDRVAETDHDTSVSSTANDVTQTLSYNGYSASTSTNSPASRPDEVQAVTTKTGTGSTTAGFGYDTAGNTTGRPGQTVGYDAEGRTSTVKNTTTNTTTSYTYAADGTLLLQRNPASKQTILYLPFGEEIHLDTGTGAVSGLRYYTDSPDGVAVVRSSSGSVGYELTDTMKSATSTVNASTLAVTRRYFDPYGNPRGSVPTSWPDQRGYLDQPQDSTTGLSLLGARNYDPTLGRFLSVDPLLENGDARQMNGYSYAADNPVNSSDPTGLRACLDTCGGGEDQAANKQAATDRQKQAYQRLVDDAENQAIDNCASGGCMMRVVHNYTNPYYAAVGAQRYQNNLILRQQEAEAAKQATAAASASHCGWFSVCGLKRAAHDVYQASGAEDVVNCATHPTFGSCALAVVNVGMAVTTGGEGNVLEAGFRDLAETGAKDLTENGAKDTARSRIADAAASCATHSFKGDTGVLMADGTVKPIRDVKSGDVIENAEPAGRTEKHRVDVTHTTYTDRDFTDVTISTPDGPRTITGTQNHPYYDLTTAAFTDAARLRPGDRLQTSGTATVLAVRNYTAAMITYDLTIDGLHTYYVEAGGTAVLVHNEDCEQAARTFAVDSKGTATDVSDLYSDAPSSPEELERLTNPWELEDSPGPYPLPPSGPVPLATTRLGRFVTGLARLKGAGWHHLTTGDPTAMPDKDARW
jgi:RHS repeat-associated protein